MITHLIQTLVLFNQLKNALRPFVDDQSLDKIIVLLEGLGNRAAALSADDLLRAITALALQLKEQQEATNEGPEDSSRYIVAGNPPDPSIWMAKKLAWDYLGIGKTTLEEKVATGELRSYHMKGADKQVRPRVFFRRSELAAYRDDYSRKKGKTR